jgi:hypothetical protein
MIIDAAGERSEQGRFLSKSPGSRNAVLGNTERHSQCCDLAMPASRQLKSRRHGTTHARVGFLVNRNATGSCQGMGVDRWGQIGDRPNACRPPDPFPAAAMRERVPVAAQHRSQGILESLNRTIGDPPRYPRRLVRLPPSAVELQQDAHPDPDRASRMRRSLPVPQSLLRSGEAMESACHDAFVLPNGRAFCCGAPSQSRRRAKRARRFRN